MATYIYQADDGSTLELERPITSAPKLGSWVRRNGKTYRRVLTVPQTRVSINPHFVSHSLPLAQMTDKGLYSPYSKDVDPQTRKPRFTSWKGVREAEAFSKYNDGARAVKYD